MMFPQQIMNLIAGKVALDRLQAFMEVGRLCACGCVCVCVNVCGRMDA